MNLHFYACSGQRIEKAGSTEAWTGRRNCEGASQLVRYLYAITDLASQLVGSNCTRRQAKTTARAGWELTKRITAINHRAELLRTPQHTPKCETYKPSQSSTRNTELTPITTHRSSPHSSAVASHMHSVGPLQTALKGIGWLESFAQANTHAFNSRVARF